MAHLHNTLDLKQDNTSKWEDAKHRGTDAPCSCSAGDVNADTHIMKGEHVTPTCNFEWDIWNMSVGIFK